VLAFHQEHYPEVRSFDDFIPQLTLEQWDADTVAQARGRRPGCATWSRSPSTTTGLLWDTDLTPRSSARQDRTVT